MPEYQYPLVSIPESYPDILSMDIHTLPKPETHLIKTSNNVTITASQTKNQTLEFNKKRAN